MANINKQLNINILKILDTARFSPSVHNTQPWRVKIVNNSIIVKTDKEYALKYGDPTGRETFISLGIFTEALIIASSVCGLYTKSVRLMQDNSIGINLTNRGKNIFPETYVKYIKSRCSDRSIYKQINIPDELLKNISNSYKKRGVRIWTFKDSSCISLVADLTSKGIGVALTNPNFRKELSNLLIPYWSKDIRGIPVKSLRIPRVLTLVEPTLIRNGIGLKHEINLEKERWRSASAIVFITTSGDMPEDWLLAGRAYLHAAITIEEINLSQATSAAIVEASTFHEDIEDFIGTNQRLQAVLRVGSSENRRVYSPRVSAKNLIVTSNP